METKSTQRIQRITREYYENLHSHRLENLEEMDIFLDAYDLSPNLSQDDINHLNRSITGNETEAVIKVSQQRKA
jgi:hypothetical protein